MTVEAISSSNLYPSPLSAVQIRNHPHPPKQQAGAAAADSGGEQKAAGVLRLLEAGHFKGVADVRLRIVFHDQLQAAETAATKSAVQQAATALTEAVGAELTELGSSAQMDEQQLAALADHQQTFEDTVGGATQDFLAAGQPAGQALTGSTQQAFDALVASLDSLLAPQPTALPGDANGDGIVDSQDFTILKANFGQTGTDVAGDVNQDGVVDGQDWTILKDNFGTVAVPVTAAALSDAADPLADLKETFEAAMADLAGALSGPSPLGGTSASNGAAYSKFAAQYNALLGLEETAAAPEPAADPINVEV